MPQRASPSTLKLARAHQQAVPAAAVIARLFLLLLGLACAQPAIAGHRGCTSSEKLAADRQLWLNAADKSGSLSPHLPWGAPAIPPTASNEQYLIQRDYVILYDGDLRVPLLTAERIAFAKLKSLHRTDCFRRDVRIDAPLDSKPSDYDEPIFDQGHLAAFANQTRSKIAGLNSFLRSNGGTTGDWTERRP